jgi:hypothetical protein
MILYFIMCVFVLIVTIVAFVKEYNRLRGRK